VSDHSIVCILGKILLRLWIPFSHHLAASIQLFGRLLILWSLIGAERGAFLTVDIYTALYKLEKRKRIAGMACLST
jgi:hypothetical protein